MNIKFEKRSGAIYPAYFHVGGYSIALNPETIQSLKGLTALDTTPFYATLVQIIGSNRYLKEMVQEGIAAGGDQNALSRQLKKEIQSL